MSARRLNLEIPPLAPPPHISLRTQQQQQQQQQYRKLGRGAEGETMNHFYIFKLILQQITINLFISRKKLHPACITYN